MRIKLLIAVADGSYAEHLSSNLSEKHTDSFEVSVCSTAQRLRDILAAQKFEAALLDASLIKDIDLRPIHLPLLLWAEEEQFSDTAGDHKLIRKYQRISSIADEILESYAKISSDSSGPVLEKARVIVFWSPSGGVGTTTSALSYAARKVSDGKQVLYLNLESFSSTPLFFPESGKSISAAFEMLDNHEGNLKMLLRGIRRQDNGSGISYFCHPENFDDMNILSVEDAAVLITACSGITEELVVDLSCICNMRTWRIFELADRIFIVVNDTQSSQIKLSQFIAQHNVFERIRAKTAIVANKGAHINHPLIDIAISLPPVLVDCESELFKTLSASFAEQVS